MNGPVKVLLVCTALLITAGVVFVIKHNAYKGYIEDRDKANMQNISFEVAA